MLLQSKPLMYSWIFDLDLNCFLLDLVSTFVWSEHGCTWSPFELNLPLVVLIAALQIEEKAKQKKRAKVV